MYDVTYVVENQTSTVRDCQEGISYQHSAIAIAGRECMPSNQTVIYIPAFLSEGSYFAEKDQGHIHSHR